MTSIDLFLKTQPGDGASACDFCRQRRYPKKWKRLTDQPLFKIGKVSFSIVFFVLLWFGLCFLAWALSDAFAGEIVEPGANQSNPYIYQGALDQIVTAIYKAEGGKDAKVPFGILSVKCSGYADCRRICENTVRNNYKRWNVAGRKTDFLTFLAGRYAPVGAENDNGTNKHWLNNVRAALRKAGQNVTF